VLFRVEWAEGVIEVGGRRQAAVGYDASRQVRGLRESGAYVDEVATLGDGKREGWAEESSAWLR